MQLVFRGDVGHCRACFQLLPVSKILTMSVVVAFVPPNASFFQMIVSFFAFFIYLFISVFYMRVQCTSIMKIKDMKNNTFSYDIKIFYSTWKIISF